MGKLEGAGIEQKGKRTRGHDNSVVIAGGGGVRGLHCNRKKFIMKNKHNRLKKRLFRLIKAVSLADTPVSSC